MTHPVLRGFELEFLGGQRPLERVQAEVVPGTLRVNFADQSDDHPYNWKVRWADLY